MNIMALGLVAFMIGTATGTLFRKVMCQLTGGKVNPLIGSAGVSAVPMTARASQSEGRRANLNNFLLMHAMGPNVAGVIGSAITAGVLLSMLRRSRAVRVLQQNKALPHGRALLIWPTDLLPVL